MTQFRKINAVLAGEDSTITVGGIPLHGVTAATVHYEPHVTPVLHLTLSIHEVIVEGEATVEIPGRVHDALLALGWTPPED